MSALRTLMSKFKTDPLKVVEEEKKTNGHANGISENGANGHSEQDESSSNSPEETTPKTSKVVKNEEEEEVDEDDDEEAVGDDGEVSDKAGDKAEAEQDEQDGEAEAKEESEENADEEDEKAEESEEKKEQPKPKPKPKKTVKIKEEPGTKSPKKKAAPVKATKPKAGAVKKPAKEHVDELREFDVPPMSDEWVKENKLYFVNKDKDMIKHVNGCVEPLAGATPEEMDEGYFEGAFPKSNISRMIKEVTTNVIAHYPERCPNLYESLNPTFDDEGNVTDVEEPIKISGDAFAALHAACEEYLTDMFGRADKMRQAHGAQGLAVPHLRSAVYAAEFSKTRGVAFNFAVQKEGFIIKKSTKRRNLDFDSINKRRDELNKLGLRRFAEKYKSPELLKEEEIDKREEPTYWRKIKEDKEKLHYLERSENTQSDPTVRLSNLEEETEQDHTMIIGPGEEDHDTAASGGSSGGNNTNVKLKKVKKDPEAKEEKKQAPKKKNANLKEVKKEKKSPNKSNAAVNKQKSPQKRKASEVDQSEDERPKKKKK